MNTSIRFPNLDINFRYVGRSVSAFGVEITFYGILITAGMLAALIYMILHAKRKKEDPNLCLEMMIPSLIGGVIGARLLYIGTHWEMFSGKTVSEFLDISRGGMDFWADFLEEYSLALYTAGYARCLLCVCQILPVWEF